MMQGSVKMDVKVDRLTVLARILLLGLVVTLLPPHVYGQTTKADSRVGKKIIVTTAGAELKTPKATVWRAYPGEVFTITLVNGEWLWIQLVRALLLLGLPCFLEVPLAGIDDDDFRLGKIRAQRKSLFAC